MRPTKLTLRAFGPYADEQVFDFDELGGVDFFLIHGPTGSGKSTILDAMCFALYGKTSGGERTASDLRSQYAKPAETTEVVFEFALWGETFKIERIPEHERAKKRGEGRTQQSHNATLYRRSGDECWEVLESKTTGVVERVEGLLGFDVEQFRQVVMLPQGRFREFLSSGSSDKQKLLAKLFDTARYGRFAEILKEEKKQIEASRKELVSLDAGEFKRWDVEDLEGLQLARDARLVELKEDQQEQKKSKKILVKLESQFLVDEKMAEHFAELDLAVEVLELIEARADEQAQEQSRLEQALLAKGLQDVLADLKRRREEDKDFRAGFASAEKAHAEQEKQHARTLKELKAEEDKGQEREDLAIRLKEMDDLKEQAQALSEARKAQAEAQDVQTGLSEELRLAEAAIEKKKTRQQQAQEALKQAEGLAAGMRALELEHEKGVKQLAEAQKAQKVASDRKRLEHEIAKLGQKAGQTKARRDDKRAELDRTEQAWLYGQAQVLARELKAGEACPVCGSTAHPVPAEANDEREAPSELHVLEALRKGHDELDALAETAAEALQGKELELARLGDSQPEVEGMTEAQLDERALKLKTLEKDISQAGKAQEAQKALLGDLARTEKEIDAAGAKRKDVDSALREAEKHSAVTKAATEACLGKLPEDLRAEGVIEALRSEVVERMSFLDEALKEAKKKHESAEESARQSAKKLAGAQVLMEKAVRDLDTAQGVLDERLLRTPFTDEAEIRRAWLNAEDLRRLEKAIKDWTEELKSTKDRLGRAKEKVAGKDRPDLESARQAVGIARAKLDALLGLMGKLQERIDEMGSAAKTLGERAKERDRLEARFEVVGDLEGLANDRHLPFERWVLTALLDDVLVRASARLHVMSQGRYRIRRETKESTYGGLDMVVEDAHSGQDRPVSTLSGGEGFMASLALALGLSDVVQSYAGGIHLDTLFIDEGFGSLDPEALDQAISSLMELNISGRLVGIISHVEELKQRIPARLEIEKSKRGSRARFVM